ncbi:MAG: sporulation protein, partial [Firmicutes bacterium]|nr:sporulation protein [Bacillota bacterium]
MSDMNQSLEVLFNKMEDFVSTKTVVGDAITIGGLVVLPLIEVSVGVGAGSTEGKGGTSGGGGGLGAKITPSAVIVINDGVAQLINIKNQDAISKLIDMAPGIAQKIAFKLGKKEPSE